ncbi:MAG: YceD family protein [Burkholderiaceae bacterium]|nr:YceD family protein [Burkholderiaceae bacterium]
MTKDYTPDRLDIKAFVQAGAHLQGYDSLLKYERLMQEAQGLRPDLYVDWQARGELRAVEGLAPELWLHLTVQAIQPLLCQRCLTPVDVPLEVDRWFRFVANEAAAEALDDETEEDLLAISREFDLRALIEDELLMDLPVVARHDECPVSVPMASSSEEFDAAEAEKPNPFAALSNFKAGKSSH